MREIAEISRFIPFMEAVNHNLLQLKKNLSTTSYQYEYDLPQISGANEEKLREAIDYLRSFDVEPPASVIAFYLTQGAIEFTGPVPADWGGCEYPDPISIAPIDKSYIEGEKDVWDDLKIEYLQRYPETEFAYLISGDHVHKAGFSGGCYYLAFDGKPDALIEGSTLNHRFCDYLRLCDTWGGFPGLRFSKKHDWPIEQLRSGFKELPEIGEQD